MDDVVDAVGCWAVFFTLQVTLNDVVCQRECAPVFEGLEVAIELIARQFERSGIGF